MFLLGAGASVDAGVPATFEMTERLVGQINDDWSDQYSQALNFVCGALIAYDSAGGKRTDAGLDVERVFAAIELLAERDELEVTPFVASWHPAVDAWDRKNAPAFFDKELQDAVLGKSGKTARAVIEGLVRSMSGAGTGDLYRGLGVQMIENLRRIVASPYADLSYLTPLVELARSSRSLTIASLNYDLTIEQACSAASVPIDTGIDHWIVNRRWSWSENGVRLLKLHGSIDWCWDKPQTEAGEMPMRTVAHSADPEAEERFPVLVFGQRNKLRADGPFLSLLSEFENMLSESDRLIVVGYSFRDDHINEIIRRWTHDDKTRRLSLVDPHPVERRDWRGFREILLRSLNPQRRGGQPPPDPRVDVREEGAIEAFAQLRRE